MRRVRIAACLAAALLCGGCAAKAMSARPGTSNTPNPLNSSEVLSAADKPPGYYPGYADTGLIKIADYETWLTKNQTRIDEIQVRISAIRERRIAPGCIGEDRYTCVATLAQKFAIADYSQDGSIVAEMQVDVNGKPVRRPKFEIIGFVLRPDAKAKNPAAIALPTRFVLKMTDSGMVSALEVDFTHDPMAARTQEQYDATDVYEAVSAVSAKNCPTLSRVDVARWIENTIKPTLRSAQERERRGIAETKTSKKTAFCGRTFQFNSVWANQLNKGWTTQFKSEWATRTYARQLLDVAGRVVLFVE
jgi:hypothetical protein